jgi:hypothetical protein
MPALSLEDIWVGVTHDHGIECADIGAITGDRVDRLASSPGGSERPMLIGCGERPLSGDLMKRPPHGCCPACTGQTEAPPRVSYASQAPCIWPRRCCSKI